MLSLTIRMINKNNLQTLGLPFRISHMRDKVCSRRGITTKAFSVNNKIRWKSQLYIEDGTKGIYIILIMTP